MSGPQTSFLKWAPRITIGLSGVVFVLVGVAIYTLVHYQPKTACQSDPSGRECQRLKVESDKFRTPRSACVITRLAGLGCPALEDRRRTLPDDQFPTGKGDRNGTTTEAQSGSDGSPDSGIPSGSDGGADPGGGAPAPGPDPPPSGPPPDEPDPPSAPPSQGPPVLGDAVHEITNQVCVTVNQLGVQIPAAC